MYFAYAITDFFVVVLFRQRSWRLEPSGHPAEARESAIECCLAVEGGSVSGCPYISQAMHMALQPVLQPLVYRPAQFALQRRVEEPALFLGDPVQPACRGRVH